jgi:hypothetical protein
VLQEVENIPSGKVDFIDTEDYLTKTEKFVQPTEEATLKIYSDQGVELFTNKKE